MKRCVTQTLLAPFLIALLSTEARGQGDPISVEERVDNLWERVYEAPDSVLRAVRSLLEESRKKNAYRANVNALQLMGECHYGLLNLDSCTHYFELALIEAEREDDLREMAHVHTSLGGVLSEQGERDRSLAEFDKAVEIWITLGDTKQLCGTEVRLAGTYDRFDLDDKAMEYFKNALEHCGAVGDSVFMAHALNGIGILHKKQLDHDKALEVLEHARSIYARFDDRHGSAGVLNNLGVVYKSLGRYEEARACYVEGLRLMEQMGSERGIMSFNQNLGILENLEGRPDKGLEHCSRSLVIANAIGLAATQSEALNEIAKSLHLLERPQAALDSVDKAIAIAARASLLDKEQQAWSTRGEVLEALGRHPEAIASLRTHVQLRDSLFSLEKAAAVDRLQVMYETEQREATIARLEEQAHYQQARKRWLRIGIIALAAAAIIIVLSLLQRRRRERQLHAAQLGLQQAERQRLQEQLDHKRRELTEKALHLAQKNELMRGLEQDIKMIKDQHGHEALDAVANKLRFDKQIDRDWEQFTMAFTEMDREFFERLTARHPTLNTNDLRLCALLTMKLGNKEVAAILNVSDEGVKKARYRLRKKLELATEDDLEGYLATC